MEEIKFRTAKYKASFWEEIDISFAFKIKNKDHKTLFEHEGEPVFFGYLSRIGCFTYFISGKVSQTSLGKALFPHFTSEEMKLRGDNSLLKVHSAWKWGSRIWIPVHVIWKLYSSVSLLKQIILKCFSIW